MRTKEDVKVIFKSFYHTAGRGGITKAVKEDREAVREAWGIYTDELCKAGEITAKQYETWTNPF